MAANAKPNLLRHKSGRYYARAFAGGKEVRKSLKIFHYSVAEAKLADRKSDLHRVIFGGPDFVNVQRSFRVRFDHIARICESQASCQPLKARRWRLQARRYFLNRRHSIPDRQDELLLP